MFPLLTLLFEKCEQATQGSECITSASFDVDIENFVHQQEQEHKPFFSDDPELDNLVEWAGAWCMAWGAEEGVRMRNVLLGPNNLAIWL